LQEVGELDGKIGTLAQQTISVHMLLASPAHLLESLEEPVEVLRKELLAEGGIDARPREFVLGDQVAHGPLAWPTLALPFESWT